MAYVVTEPCVNCKYTNCASVCPVDAFREGPNFVTIDPDECIDCDACRSECPVEAIYPEDEVPAKWEHYIEWNAKLATNWADHVINTTNEPMESAEEWSSKEGKDGELKENW